ncbi:MAG: hypothetical protein IKD80_04115 [Selenomonadaceae bacterium]|nr:hypothetical protein [Selenomonadaceae bacterium]
MSKNKSYQFLGTIGDIIDLIKSLPPTPTQKFFQTWKEFIIEKAVGHTTAREFYHILTKLRVRFDPAKEGAPGFEGKDHWHIRNPNTNGKQNRYLDKDANPVRKGADEFHIIPKQNGDD